MLEKCKTEVPSIDHVLEKEQITLGWQKLSSKSKSSFILTTTWNHIVHKHHLNEDALVQVWSFQAINPNFNHDNLDDDLNGHLDDNCNDDQDDDNADDDLNDDLNDDYGQLHLALILVWRGDLVLKEGGNKGSCSRSNKG